MGFVVRPPARVNHRPIGPCFYATPVHFAVGPFSVVLVAVGPHVHALAVHFAVLKLALVLPCLFSATVDPCNLTLFTNHTY